MAKRPTKKQLAARRKFVAAVRAGRFRKKTARKRVRKNLVKNSRKKATFGERKCVIRASYETKNGYRYYYLRGDNWVAQKSNATRYSKKGGRCRMEAIKDRLEAGITMITLVPA